MSLRHPAPITPPSATTPRGTRPRPPGLLLVALALAVLPACTRRAPQPGAGSGEPTPPATTGAPAVARPAAAALASFNRGAALLEQYRYPEAAQAFEAVLALVPDWDAARYNLGLAYLNAEGRDGTTERLAAARDAFETVLKHQPDHRPARFALGLAHQYGGDMPKALECFQAVARADDRDPYVLYKVGETLAALDRDDEAAPFFKKAAEINPGFVSAVYRVAMQAQADGKPEEAAPLFERFKQLNALELTGGTVAADKSYGMAGPYYRALGADSLPLPPPASGGSGPRRVIFFPEVKPLPAPGPDWDWSTVAGSIPGVAASDLDGDGHLDVIVAGGGPKGTALFFRGDGQGGFTPARPLPVAGGSPWLGDVDNRGRLDLWLGGDGARLLRGDGRGALTPADVTAATGPGARVSLVDLDVDGDLDLLAFGRAKGVVLQNNGNGTFTDIATSLGLDRPGDPVAALVADDFDADLDPDLVLFPRQGKPIAWVNDRAGRYHFLPAETTGLNVEGVISTTTADVNKDGRRDLVVFAKDGLHLFLNKGDWKFEEHADFRIRFGSLGGTGGQFADLNNDGHPELVIADARRKDGTRGPVLLLNDWPRPRFVDAAEADPGTLLSAVRTDGDAGLVVADFHGQGRPDILLAPAGKSPVLLRNVTPGGHWIALDLVGIRDRENKARANTSALGARVEIRAGTLFQQYVLGLPAGAAGQAPLRLHAGLGDNPRVDWLRIIWPDGVLQAEMDLPADRVARLEELPRKTSSCPHLFAWDGTGYRFVSDFGGGGGLGYLTAPGVYAPPTPREVVPLPPLAPRDGDYVLKVLEPLEEVVYFDEARLLAVDHPEGTEVVPSGFMPVAAPAPPFEVFCYSRPIDPVRATDQSGRDVTDLVRTIDRRTAGAVQLDRRFTGYAAPHHLDLDFGDRLASLPRGARPVLFLHGWVEYPYSSTNYAAAQAGVRLQAPTISVRRDGRWVDLAREPGYPAGLNHTMTLDLSGKLFPTDRLLRVSTTMELYWDRIWLAAVEPPTSCKLHEAPAHSADLVYRGFPREYTPDGRAPNLHDYHNVDRSVGWKTLPGDYTRHGDVTELLRDTDDRFVILAPGDEVTLRFAATAFPPIPPGRHRAFLLKTDSYCKDMDPHTAHPDRVEPLPFHGMTTYPYGPNEHYPDAAPHRAYRQRYNTRRLP